MIPNSLKKQSSSLLRVAALIAAAAVMWCSASANENAPGVRVVKYPWTPDDGTGMYANPVIHADYSDPDVVRMGDEYIMVSSSFAHTPGLPVLRSEDLVNWTIVGHVTENLPSPMFDLPQHGKGIWAPSIRMHNGELYVYFGDPDLGIFMSKAKKAEGPWEPLRLIQEAKGWIDPCPLWDDDGNAYLVHGWAKSRAGFNSILTVNKMNAEGTRILDSGVTVFDGHRNHPTIEGPKFYKRNGYYYVFAPAGGVKPGWQTVLRSKNVYGPYDDKIVLAQGSTAVNGPHQGAWVATPTGEDWFIHFQDRYAYGRIVHLQPMRWNNDWPVMGFDREGRGCGEPVSVHALPRSAKKSPRQSPQTSDEFTSNHLGFQWQWEANHQSSWYSLSAAEGALRLAAVPMPESSINLWDVPNLVCQKFPAETFTTTTLMKYSGLAPGERAGLVVFGMDYAYLAVERDSAAWMLKLVFCTDASKRGRETVEARVPLQGGQVYARVHVDSAAVCDFSFSTDGKKFIPMGKKFTAREGMWVGAKAGLFASGLPGARTHGYADFDWFRYE
jgi:beta-xylosidase